MPQSTAPLTAAADDLLVSFPKAAKQLGVCLRTLENWLRRKDPRMPPTIRVGRFRYIARDQIDARRKALGLDARAHLDHDDANRTCHYA